MKEMSKEEEAKFEREYKEAQIAQDQWAKENHFREIDIPHCGNCKNSGEMFEGEGHCSIMPQINSWSLLVGGSVSETQVCDRWEKIE